jgi:uncharacterized membrane protein
MDETSHAVTPLYSFALIFPATAVLVSWGLYYGRHQNTPGRIVTISQTVAPFPQCRIFSVAMCIEAFVTLGLAHLRNAAFVSRATASGQITRRLYLIGSYVMLILPLLIAIFLVMVSCVTADDYFPVHITGAFGFFACASLYYIVSDIALAAVDIGKCIASRAATGLTILFSILYMALMLPKRNQGISNARSIFQYLAALSLFTKMFLFQFDCPRHHFAVHEAQQAVRQGSEDSLDDQQEGNT